MVVGSLQREVSALTAELFQTDIASSIVGRRPVHTYDDGDPTRDATVFCSVGKPATFLEPPVTVDGLLASLARIVRDFVSAVCRENVPSLEQRIVRP